MTQWFYYNENGEKIEVTGGQLKGLAKTGVITPDTIVETADGKTAPARRVKGLTFIAAAQPDTVTHESTTPEAEVSSPASPIGENPFVAEVQSETVIPESATPEPETYGLSFSPTSVAWKPFVLAPQAIENPLFNNAESSDDGLTKPSSVVPPTSASMEVHVSFPTEHADIQPLCAELMGMKPEMLFIFMYIAAIFATTIIGFFIPIILWALTKEKDKRADLHGKHIIYFMILYEACLLMGIMFLHLGVVGTIAAFIFSIYAIVIFVQLIVHACYAVNGKVPVYPDGIWVAGKMGGKINGHWGKRHWVYCPSPATSVVSQPGTVPVTPGSSVDEIKKMKELLDCGAITQEEFDAFKKKTLGI